jgi:hypothetical protein
MALSVTLKNCATQHNRSVDAAYCNLTPCAECRYADCHYAELSRCGETGLEMSCGCLFAVKRSILNLSHSGPMM